MATDYRYQGFISYSHADRRVATWLQRMLERFRIPARLVAEHSLKSNRFLPLFRDQDELAAAHHLPDVLQEALAASRHLIVICSPAAADSAWVDQEVRAFIELGYSDRIICLLVAGDPSEPATCFPPALRGATIPLAVDLRPGRDDRKTVLLKIAATLLDVGYDQLRQRAVQARRRSLARQTVAGVVAVAAIAFISYRVAVQPPCQNAEERLAEIWSPQVRADIEASFLGTRLPYAATALTNVLGRLQIYHDEWVAMHTQACEATLVHNEQSPQLMDLRMACLDERRQEFSSFTQLLQEANPKVVETAVASAGRLRSLSRCADAEQLQAAYPLPDDPREIETIRELQVAVARAGVTLATGGMEAVSGQLPALLARSERTEYPALEAEALLLKSRFEMFSGRAAAAKDATFSAAAKAVRARDNELVARVWLTLPDIALNAKGDLEEIMQLLELARSYIAQLPPNHPLEADFHGARGETLMRLGELERGVRDMRVAVEISRALNLPQLSQQLSRLAWGLTNLHQPESANEAAIEALTITEQEFGSTHPEYARALKEIARVQSQLGNREQALALQQQVVAIEEGLFPDAHPVLATSIVQLGWTYTQAGQFDEAVAAFKRALAMEREFEDPDWSNIAAAYNNLGDAYISKGDYEQAREALEAALGVWVEQGQKASIGIALGNLGNTSNRAGRYTEAADYCQRSYDNDVQFLPAEHPDLAYPLTCLGEARLGKGMPSAALAPLQQAHALRNRIDVDEGLLAWTRWLYGRALWESGRDTATGMIYVRFAEDTFRSLGDATSVELADVERWLRDHGAGNQ